ncbi:TraB/GumN family protein [Flavobacterium sp. MFBS3-15]|uniref:TraB/GumN family protein n=1 Tax=Flavobacterium sp. MFBS3-15 TaxID=2989816 RepID=UPI0022363B86|nr:TraB/GumN family protein [Flavobacterium sp. MFBS3-15]MCW4468203.1 TraB/GumN family protein [Flavobacterium sp. MFBS3-15]
MKRLALLLLFAAASLSAQEKKYQSLLWEISGNGLEKKSYLYGSMHVSNKVSYNLSDAFFTHLLNADMVAGESDPATWGELTGMMSQQRPYYLSMGYSGFYFKPVGKDGLRKLFSSNSYSLNSLLSRTDETDIENQEDTYLDMFIYRTGRKYNKISVGLEDAKTSVLTIMKVDPTSVKPLENNRAAIQKALKNMSYQDALTHYYREKDLDMIDSLMVLAIPENYLKALLYERNGVMAASIDSLSRKGSLFAAVGAAHLPGKNGVIEALRKKGFTVTPVFDTYGEKGLEKKQQIEAYYVKPSYRQYTTPDGMVTLPLFNQVMESRAMTESPDLANGGYITLKRTLLADFLKKDNKPFDHRSLDSLFYENVQGKILEKKFYTQGSYPYYDIKSTTRTGNAQRYRYYITPLEVITVIMSGEGNYVRQFENDIFSNITFKTMTGKWTKAAPARGGFSVSLPENRAVYGDMQSYTPEDVQMVGYDNGAAYFITEKTFDYATPEDTRFELQRMHYEFYANFDADSTDTAFDKKPLAFLSSAKVGSKDIRLKSVIHGAKYYLMGTVGAADADTEKFFNSFAIEKEAFRDDFRTYADTIGKFTVAIPKRENERLDFVFNYHGMADDDEDTNYFIAESGSVSFVLPSGRKIDVSYSQGHRYEALKPADSVWADIRRNTVAENDYYYNEDDEYALPLAGRKGVAPSTWPEKIWKRISKDSRKRITAEKMTNNKEEGYSQWDFLLEQDNSEQAIKQRYYYRNGFKYDISTLVEKGYKNDDREIEKVFGSFAFTDKVEEGIDYDRVARFIEDTKSEHDSIRRSAIRSALNLRISEKDLPAMMEFLKGFEYKTDESYSVQGLYNKIGQIQHPSVIPFLEKQYKKEGIKASEQFMLLNALTGQKSRAGYKKLLELLEYDLPLSDREYDVSGLFAGFSVDPENSQVLMPDIFQFFSVPEYHAPIVDFVAGLLSEEAIKPGKVKPFKKMVLTGAKLELKRAKSRMGAEEEEVDEYYGYINVNNQLTGYINLLYPFRNDKDIKPFFKAVKEMKSKQETLELARLDIVKNNITPETLQPLLEDPETLFTVYNIGNISEKENLVKKVGGQDIAASAIYILNNKKKDKKQLEFLEKKTVPYYGFKADFYFFRVTAKDPEDDDADIDELAAVAFLQNEDGSMDTHAYRRIETKEIIDEDELEKYKKSIIDQTLNEYNSRAQTITAADMQNLLYNQFE